MSSEAAGTGSEQASAEPALEVRRYAGGPFGENAYLVRCTATDRTVVVDPGFAAPEIVRTLEETGWDVQAIYLTHSHVDHVDGIPAIRAHTAAPIFLHPDARPIYDRAVESARKFGLPITEPLPEPDEDIVPGRPLPVGDSELEVRHTPGHAPGHVTLYAPDSGFALVGDVIFRGSIGRTDLPGGDFQELMHSIRSQILTLPDETVLLSGHGPETRVGDERRGNPFLISQAPGSLA